MSNEDMKSILRPSSSLKNGEYLVGSLLGQGGFGITYEAEQVNLGRRVAIKEFFMKDCCERDGDTSHVSVPTQSNRALVEKFRGKFVKEARMLASFDHSHIVRVLDVFEENGTAYYVMENLPGGSLVDKVKKEGPLSEEQAERYIRQVADALAYIHERDTVHLDVKPSNILLNGKGKAVLIDFGISKHYDQAGEQTSSTPVGISKGYAPLEQSRDGDVSQFKPSTDIYALGATLYFLVTGVVPPEASIVNEDGLDRPKGVSDRIWLVIEQCMQPRRKDRPQSVEGVLALLDSKEETEVKPKPQPQSKPVSEQKPQPVRELQSEPASVSGQAAKPKKTWLWLLLAGLVVLGVILAIVLGGKKQPVEPAVTPPDNVTTEVVSTPAESNQEQVPAPVIPGSLKISSTPSGATIWLDGKDTKKITPDLLDDLVPGKHKIKLSLDGYKDYSGSVTITSAKRLDFSKTLEVIPQPKEESKAIPQADSKPESKPEPAVLPGSVKVTSTPSGASIWLDGKDTKKTTPDVIEGLVPGSYSIKLMLEGYVDYSGSITIASNKLSELSGTLKMKEKPTTGLENGHEWVDLGLSVKWATCNVGASSPSDYGNYYAWGETNTKSEYSWSTLRYGLGTTGDTFTKYNTKSDNGSVDNKTRLNLSDDVARTNWGGRWRMPTAAEWEELRARCFWTWTSQRGQIGYSVTSKVNGNSIFLPAAGYRDHTDVVFANYNGDYWSSTFYADDPNFARYMSFSSTYISVFGRYRYYGHTVRPVTN